MTLIPRHHRGINTSRFNPLRFCIFAIAKPFEFPLLLLRLLPPRPRAILLVSRAQGLRSSILRRHQAFHKT
ncbi:hypothetical protein J5N97_026875 [Dioscorea zingiberensis]|uniref:Uncharacterized protein n=1 Tax=Dioscorea zingiberensis TaxID=325984 RepID=A0A9D5C326_9LILI|nr:hypothetical protein J5N97_026875 [Dioscorea zingiberensis]